MNDDLRLAIGAINRVHGDGALPPIEASLGGMLHEQHASLTDGYFSFNVTVDGAILPRSINVRANAPNRSFVLVHEIGHFIDAVGLPGIGFSSASDTAKELGGWREAVEGSRAVRDLEGLEHHAGVEIRYRATDLGQADEIWARSYAQFVTVRSGSNILLTSLNAVRRHSVSDVYLPGQWDDEDFGPIDTEIAKTIRHRRHRPLRSSLCAVAGGLERLSGRPIWRSSD